MGEHIKNSRSSFSRELPTWQPPVIFPPCLNVRELDVTGREGLEWGGRNLFSGIFNSCWPLLRVTPENTACDDADAEKPPFKWQSHLHLQRFAENASAQLQRTAT